MSATRMWLVGGFLTTALLACTTFGVAPVQETTGNDTTPARPPDAGASNEAAPPLPEAGADAAISDDAGTLIPDGHWQGALSEVKSVSYGGGADACAYSVTFSDVTVDLQIEDGAPAAATVTATVTTTWTGAIACFKTADPAAGSEEETYSLAPLPGDADSITLAPAATNGIQASLVLQGDFSGDASTVNLTWTRTDQSDTPSFQWTVYASVPTVQAQ